MFWTSYCDALVSDIYYILNNRFIIFVEDTGYRGRCGAGGLQTSGEERTWIRRGLGKVSAILGESVS